MFAESIALSERPDVRPRYVTTAVFSMSVPTGSGAESTTTWNVTVVDCPAASVPPFGIPVPAPAPVPSWKATAPVPEKYSPWSASTASVFVPAFAPERIWSEPGLKVVWVGIASWRNTFTAESSASPALLTTIV